MSRTTERHEADLVAAAIKLQRIPEGAEGLRPHHFGDKRAGLAWGRMRQMVADDIPLRLESAMDALGDLGDLWPRPTADAPDPLEWLSDACGYFPTDAEIGHAIRTVMGEWAKREQARSAEALTQAIQAGDDGRASAELDNLTRLRLEAAGRVQRGLAAGWRPLPGEWLAERPAPREFLLTLQDETGVLPRGKAGVLAAAGGVGKSYALCQLALATATGHDWLGMMTHGGGHLERGGRVLLLAGEEEPEELRRRLYNCARVMGFTDQDRELAERNLFPIGLAGVDVALLQDGEHGPEETAFLQDIRRRLEKDGPWALVIIDPLSRFGGMEFEKDNSVATRVVVAIESLTAVAGAPTVFVAHHTSQAARNSDAKPKDDEAAATEVRGATAIVDGFRFAMQLRTRWQVAGNVTADKGARLETWQTLRVTKSNYGRKPQPLDVVRDGDTKGALRVATKDEIGRLQRAMEEAKPTKGNGAAKGKAEAKGDDIPI